MRRATLNAEDTASNTAKTVNDNRRSRRLTFRLPDVVAAAETNTDGDELAEVMHMVRLLNANDDQMKADTANEQATPMESLARGVPSESKHALDEMKHFPVSKSTCFHVTITSCLCSICDVLRCVCTAKRVTRNSLKRHTASSLPKLPNTLSLSTTSSIPATPAAGDDATSLFPSVFGGAFGRMRVPVSTYKEPFRLEKTGASAEERLEMLLQDLQALLHPQATAPARHRNSIDGLDNGGHGIANNAVIRDNGSGGATLPTGSEALYGALRGALSRDDTKSQYQPLPRANAQARALARTAQTKSSPNLHRQSTGLEDSAKRAALLRKQQKSAVNLLAMMSALSASFGHVVDEVSVARPTFGGMLGKVKDTYAHLAQELSQRWELELRHVEQQRQQ